MEAVEAMEAAETFEDKIFNHLESFKKSKKVEESIVCCQTYASSSYLSINQVCQ